MIYTGNTKPEYHSIQQAAGENVFTHKLNPPSEVLAFKNMGLNEPPKEGWPSCDNFQNSVDFAKWGIHFAQVDVSFLPGRAETSSLGGIDYPRTLQEFDDWFATKDKCANYLIMSLCWPRGVSCPGCGSQTSRLTSRLLSGRMHLSIQPPLCQSPRASFSLTC